MGSCKTTHCKCLPYFKTIMCRLCHHVNARNFLNLEKLNFSLECYGNLQWELLKVHFFRSEKKKNPIYSKYLFQGKLLAIVGFSCFLYISALGKSLKFLITEFSVTLLLGMGKFSMWMRKHVSTPFMSY